MAIDSYDIVSTLQALGMMKYWKGKHIILKKQVGYNSRNNKRHKDIYLVKAKPVFGLVTLRQVRDKMNIFSLMVGDWSTLSKSIKSWNYGFNKSDFQWALS